MRSERPILGRLRQPAYTGKHRCWPCTTLNVVLAGAITVLVAAVVAVGVALVVFAGALAAIALRGYLVPGTPTLTRRLLPDWLRNAIHTDTDVGADGWERSANGADPADDSDDPISRLLEVGILRRASDGYELRPAVEDRIQQRLPWVPAAGVDEGVVGDLVDREPGEFDLVERGTPAVLVDGRIRRWPSEAAIHADLAIHQVLSSAIDQWEATSLDGRLAALAAVRSAFDRCPACGGALDRSEHVVETCCSRAVVWTLRCPDCEAVLRERSTADAGQSAAARSASA